MKRILILTIIINVLLGVKAKADSGRLYTSDELTSSSVSCICQDNYGYIWVGTECGLNKFDGYHFMHYFADNKDTTTVSDSDISVLYVDKVGQLWVGTAHGLSRFDYHSQSFVRYSFPGDLSPRVSSIVENGNGLLIGTSGYGLFSIRKGTDMLRPESPKLQNSEEDYYNRMYFDPKGWLWRGSHEAKLSRYLLDKDNHTVKTERFSLPYGAAVCFLQKDKRTMLVVCLYGIMAYDLETGKLTDAGYDLSALYNNVSIRNAGYDKHHNLYVCTSGNGLMKIAAGTTKLVEAFADNILLTANANAVLIDKNENIWTTCYNRGLYKKDNTPKPFKCLVFSSNDIKTGSGLSSMTLGKDGRLWCTMQNNGIYVFDNNGTLVAHPKAPVGTGMIYCDNEGDYWLCTEKTMYKYNTAREEATPVANLDGWGLSCIVEDKAGRLYVSNFGKGLFVYDKKKGTSKSFSMNQYSKTKGYLWNDWIMAMTIDRRGMLWIATAKGVSRMNTKTGEFTKFDGDCLLPETNCTAIAEDRDGNIYVGTNSGLYRFSYDTNKIELVESSSVLYGKMINNVIADKDNNIWLGTSNGIWLCEYGTDRFLSYIHGYGLMSREYRRGSAVQKNGFICFGANDGITAFKPDDVKRMNISLGEIYLTNFFVAGRYEDCQQDRFTIPYGDSNFLMQFSMLDYSNTQNIRFEYRLNKNNEWTSIPEGSNTIYFNRMMPGTYRLEVRAVCNGIVSKNTKTIVLDVEHPWYNTTVAYLIYTLMALAVVGMAFVMYRRHKRKELEEAKMQFLINATHDIRSPLTLILGPLSRLKTIIGDGNGKEYIETINHNAQRLLLLVNQILDERKIDKNQMKLHCNETEITEYVKNSMKSYVFRAEQRNISLVMDKKVDSLKLWIDRIHFDKVIANLLSNAFKYTPDGGSITISIDNDGKNGVIAVTDSGIGLREEKVERLFERFYQSKSAREVSSVGTGIGLNLCNALVCLHGGNITASNREDGIQGSVFTVTIPLGNNHLKPEEIETAGEVDAETKGQRKQPSKNIRVLVVDDDEEIAQYIYNELSAYYRFTIVHNGKEAIKVLLGEQRYDIVVSDVMMPEMDGISLLRAIKTNAKISDIPVILLTSKAEVADRLEGLKRGADAFLGKPFSIEELQIRIDNLVDNFRRIKGKYSGQQDQVDKVEELKVEGNDDILMKRVMKSVNAHISDPEFNVERLSADVGLSRAQLHRKMKEITGITSSEFIRNIRLEQAAKLIKEGKINITQVAYTVGYNNQTHFSTVFKKHFGMSPSEYANNKENNTPNY